MGSLFLFEPSSAGAAPMTAQDKDNTAQQPQRELPLHYERILQSVRYVILKSHKTYPEYIAGTSNNRRDSIKFMQWLEKENPTAKVRAIGLDEFILEAKPFDRPHTPAPGNLCSAMVEGHCTAAERIQSEAARAATLATLEALDTKIVIRQSEGMSNAMGKPLSKYEQHYQRALGDMRGMIESLRIAAQEQSK
jgi:hypothetical protein